MIINSNKLLSLLAKAQRLGIKYTVHESHEDDHEIHFTATGYSPYTFHIKECVVGWSSDFDTIDQAMKYLDVMHNAVVKEKERKELLDKLTAEEKELLGVKW